MDMDSQLYIELYYSFCCSVVSRKVKMHLLSICFTCCFPPRNFVDSTPGNKILIIQTDFENGPLSAQLIASAKYVAC